MKLFCFKLKQNSLYYSLVQKCEITVNQFVFWEHAGNNPMSGAISRHSN